jgi:DNA-binding transcriptional regulator YiaG
MTAADLTLLMEARDAARSGRAARLRTAAGLAQADIANTIGVTPACVSRWEAGARRPHGTRAIAYAQLLRDLAQQVAR